MTTFHSCEKCSAGFTTVACVNKYRNSVYKSLGLEVVKCRLPAECGVACGMPAAFNLVNGLPVLSLGGYCGEKHLGYVASGAWRQAQLRTLNAELDRLTAKEEVLRAQIRDLIMTSRKSPKFVYEPKKLSALSAEVSAVTEEIETKSVDLAGVMDAILADLSPDSSPKRR